MGGAFQVLRGKNESRISTGGQRVLWGVYRRAGGVFPVDGFLVDAKSIKFLILCYFS
jgi:hypothetical protein